MINRRRVAEFDAVHWLSPGLSDIDSVHWTPYMTASELGLEVQKLVLDQAAPTVIRTIERTSRV